MPVYHTFNPYLPAIGRVLQALFDLAPIGSPITVSNRDLARLADLKSAGHIPAVLRQLEADEMIERQVTTRGSVIIVIAQISPDPEPDQGDQVRDQEADPELDHQGIIDQQSDRFDPHRDQAKTRHSRASQSRKTEASTSDPKADPPTPPIRYKHVLKKHEQLKQQNSSLSAEQQALRKRLIAVSTYEDLAIAVQVADTVLERNPQLTLSEFEIMLQTARSRRNLEHGGIALVFFCLLNNQPLYGAKKAQETNHDAQSSAVSSPRAGRYANSTQLQPGQPGYAASRYANSTQLQPGQPGYRGGAGRYANSTQLQPGQPGYAASRARGSTQS
jgi:hypothetical protein